MTGKPQPRSAQQGARRCRPAADNKRDPHDVDLVEVPLACFHPLETVVAMNNISDSRNSYRVSFIYDLLVNDQAERHHRTFY
jgi:hypothetical protein